METETRTTRFCLTCNYVTRIIDPITSRCAKFRFRPLDNEIARARLRHIADSEALNVSDEVLDHVLCLSHGDLRRGITMLQSVCQLMNPAAVDPTSVWAPTADQLDEVAAVVPNSILDYVLQSARTGRFDEVQSNIKNLLVEGHSAHQAIDQFQELILADENMPDIRKSEVLETLALAEFRLMDGADEYLQLLSVGGGLVKAYGG